MISPFLHIHAADAVALDFCVFIAEQARTHRVSQTAIIAALRPCLTPSQPATSQAHAPAADTPATQAAGDKTDGGEDLSLSASPSVETDQPETANSFADVEARDAEANDDHSNAVASVPVTQDGSANEGGENVDTPSELTHADTLHERAGGPGSAVGSGAPIDGEKRPTVKAQVFDAHYAHPDWTAQQIAEHIGAKVGSVKPALFDARARRNAELAIIEPAPVPNPQKPVAPPPPPSGWTLRERVRIVHSQHPNWTAALISKHLGANLNSVSTYLATIRGRVQTSAPSTPARVLPNGQAGEIEMNARNEAAARAARLGKPS